MAAQASLTHMFAELSSLEDLNIPLKGSSRLRYTCMGVSRQYVVLGSNTGCVYVFGRDSLKHVKSVYGDVESSPVAMVSISPNELNVALAVGSGHVSVMEMNIDRRSKPERLRQTADHQGAAVTAMVWDSGGSSLFVGDNLGKVTQVNIPASKAKTIFTAPSQMIVRLDCAVTQLDWWGSKLLASSLTATYLLNTAKHQFSQIGKKPREGEFGACYFLEPSSNYPVIYCARPGSRMWEVDFEGNVLNTHQFKHLLATPPLPVVTSEIDFSKAPLEVQPGRQSVNFLQMLRIGEFILTWSGRGLYVFDPINVRVVLWTDAFTDKMEVCVVKNEVYVLSESQLVRRLVFLPILHLCAALVTQQRCRLSARLLLFLQNFAVRPAVLKHVKRELLPQLLAFLKEAGHLAIADKVQVAMEEVSESSADSLNLPDDETDSVASSLYSTHNSGIVVVNNGSLAFDDPRRGSSSRCSPVTLVQSGHSGSGRSSPKTSADTDGQNTALKLNGSAVAKDASEIETSNQIRETNKILQEIASALMTSAQESETSWPSEATEATERNDNLNATETSDGEDVTRLVPSEANGVYTTSEGPLRDKDGVHLEVGLQGVETEHKTQNSPVKLLQEKADSHSSESKVESDSTFPYADSPQRTAERESLGVNNGSLATARRPSSERPSSEGPSSEGPSSEGPSSEGPSSEGPSSEGPSSEGPSSEGPSSEGPEREKENHQGPPGPSEAIAHCDSNTVQRTTEDGDSTQVEHAGETESATETQTHQVVSPSKALQNQSQKPDVSASQNRSEDQTLNATHNHSHNGLLSSEVFQSQNDSSALNAPLSQNDSSALNAPLSQNDSSALKGLRLSQSADVPLNAAQTKNEPSDVRADNRPAEDPRLGAEKVDSEPVPILHEAGMTTTQMGVGLMRPTNSLPAIMVDEPGEEIAVKDGGEQEHDSLTAGVTSLHTTSSGRSPGAVSKVTRKKKKRFVNEVDIPLAGSSAGVSRSNTGTLKQKNRKKRKDSLPNEASVNSSPDHTLDDGLYQGKEADPDTVSITTIGSIEEESDLPFFSTSDVTPISTPVTPGPEDVFAKVSPSLSGVGDGTASEQALRPREDDECSAEEKVQAVGFAIGETEIVVDRRKMESVTKRHSLEGSDAWTSQQAGEVEASEQKGRDGESDDVLNHSKTSSSSSSTKEGGERPSLRTSKSEVIPPLIERLSAFGVSRASSVVEDRGSHGQDASSVRNLITAASRQRMASVKERVSKFGSSTKLLIRRVTEKNSKLSRSSSETSLLLAPDAHPPQEPSSTSSKDDIVMGNILYPDEQPDPSSSVCCIDLDPFLQETEKTQRLLKDLHILQNPARLQQVLNTWASELNQTLVAYHLETLRQHSISGLSSGGRGTSENGEEDGDDDVSGRTGHGVVGSSVDPELKDYSNPAADLGGAVGEEREGEGGEEEDSRQRGRRELSQSWHAETGNLALHRDVAAAAATDLALDQSHGGFEADTAPDSSDLQADLDSMSGSQSDDVEDNKSTQGRTTLSKDVKTHVQNMADKRGDKSQHRLNVLGDRIVNSVRPPPTSHDHHHHPADEEDDSEVELPVDWSEVCHVKDPFKLQPQQHLAVSALVAHCLHAGCLGNASTIFSSSSSPQTSSSPSSSSAPPTNTVGVSGAQEGAGETESCRSSLNHLRADSESSLSSLAEKKKKRSLSPHTDRNSTAESKELVLLSTAPRPEINENSTAESKGSVLLSTAPRPEINENSTAESKGSVLSSTAPRPEINENSTAESKGSVLSGSQGPAPGQKKSELWKKNKELSGSETAMRDRRHSVEDRVPHSQPEGEGEGGEERGGGESVEEVFDGERALFVRLHHHFLPLWRLRRLLSQEADKAVHSTWCAVLSCCQELGRGDIVWTKIQSRDVTGALDYLRSGILPNKHAFLGHVASLFGVSPWRVTDFVGEVPRQVSLEDVLHLCRLHARPPLPLLTRYLTLRLGNTPPHGRLVLIKKMCQSQEARLAVLDCLLRLHLSYFPSPSSSSSSSSSPPSSSSSSNLARLKASADNSKLSPEAVVETLACVLSLFTGEESDAALDSCWKHSYWPGCLTLLKQSDQWQRALQLQVKLDDITLLNGESAHGYTPRTLEEWRHLFHLYAARSLPHPHPQACPPSSAHLPPTVSLSTPTTQVSASASEGASSSSHTPVGMPEGAEVTDMSLQGGSTTGLSADSVSAGEVAGNKSTIDSVSGKKSTIESVSRNKSPGGSVTMGGDSVSVGDSVTLGDAAITEDSVTTKDFATADDSATAEDSGTHGDPATVDAGGGSQLSWLALGLLAAQRLGTRSAVELLQTCGAAEDVADDNGGGGGSVERALDASFYQTCLVLAALERKQKLVIHNMLEKVDSYLWAKKPVHVTPQLHYAVAMERVARQQGGMEDSHHHHNLFARLAGAPVKPEQLAEDPDCHWGVKTNIMRVCEVCQVQVTETVSHLEPGVFVFKCGHAFHKCCAPDKECPICW